MQTESKQEITKEDKQTPPSPKTTTPKQLQKAEEAQTGLELQAGGFLEDAWHCMISQRSESKCRPPLSTTSGTHGRGTCVMLLRSLTHITGT